MLAVMISAVTLIWSGTAHRDPVQKCVQVMYKEDTMPTGEGAKTKDGLNGSDYHRSHTVEDVTKRNVQTIIKLEESAKTNGDRTDRMADIIAKFCASFMFVWVHLIWFGAWVILNVLPGIPHFDPFPFTFSLWSCPWRLYFFLLSFS